MNNCPVSVVIPCIPRDSSVLFNCIKSIVNQTLLPLEVIVAYSEINDDDSNTLETQINDKISEICINKPFDVFICGTNEKQHAGENRNRGSSIIDKRTQYISYFDADDIMSIHRIKTIYDLFISHDSKMIIHSTTENISTIDNQHEITQCEFMFHDEMLAKLLRLESRNKTYKTIHPNFTHGHCSIHKNMFNHVQFPSLRYGEDMHFCKNIIRHCSKNNNKNDVIFINVPLSFYVPSEQQNIIKKK